MCTKASESDSTSSSLEDPSSISSIISNIRKKYESDPAMFINQEQFPQAPTFLRNYQTICNYNGNHLFIEAEVGLNALDTGSDPNQVSLKVFDENKAPGDIPAQYIGKQLGGDGFYRNMFPANPKVDLSEFQNAQDLVYCHVKKGENRFAKLLFGVIYSDPEAEETKYFWRPIEIYYKFVLYESKDEIVGNAIEGKIKNDVPSN